MRKNRSPDEVREWLFSQIGFWRGCHDMDIELAGLATNEAERLAIMQRASRHLKLADLPNARNQADLRDW